MVEKLIIAYIFLKTMPISKLIKEVFLYIFNSCIIWMCVIRVNKYYQTLNKIFKFFKNFFKKGKVITSTSIK